MFLDEDLDPEQLKNEGTIKWKEGDIEEAQNLWRASLKECIKYSMRGFPTTKNRDMQISLRLNLSLYHFKKAEYSECINQCNIILENVLNLEEVLSFYVTENEQKKRNLKDNKQKEIKEEIEKTTEEKDKQEKDETLKEIGARDEKEETKEITEQNENSQDKYIKKGILIKIFIRMAHAFLCLQEFDKCKQNIEMIQMLDEEHKEISILQKKMKKEEKDFHEQQKNLYRKMCRKT